MTRRTLSGCAVFVALMPLLLCLGLGVFIALVQHDPLLLVQSPLPYVEACVGVDTRRGLNVGVAWADVEFGGHYQGVATMPYHACGLVPWASLFPARGGMVVGP